MGEFTVFDTFALSSPASCCLMETESVFKNYIILALLYYFKYKDFKNVYLMQKLLWKSFVDYWCQLVNISGSD